MPIYNIEIFRYPDVDLLSPMCYTEIQGRAAFSVASVPGVSSIPSLAPTSTQPTMAPFNIDVHNDKLSSSAAVVLSTIGLIACVMTAIGIHRFIKKK